MSEMFEKMKKMLESDVECITCHGKGRIEAPKKGEYAVVFHTRPEDAKESQLAVALLQVTALSLAKLVGSDPDGIKVELTFPDCAKPVRFSLKRNPEVKA